MTGGLTGRTIVVTGAAAGLGRAIALRLAADGATVVAADLRSSDSTVEAIVAAGGVARAVTVDVTSASAIESLIEEAAGVTGRLDAVVNNAGRFGGSRILDTTDEEWDHYLDVNLRSTFLMTRAAIRRMVDQEQRDGVRGRIVNMASQLGITGPPAALGYAVAKAGVIQLTRQVAVDYGREGIVVNAIAPGRIITGDHPGEREYLDEGTIDAATEFSLSRTPFSRLGVPEDIAGAAAFLVSDDCRFVSGAVLAVDGGWTAY
ncbi:SDR family NAD(P)-dependent oxidoreductase [Herbiconiux sp. L3-i23]|uniref:SDR family NAD(P)-dependent oxidoreductase n=1 Tax=Herbiconiux sp. L3-i23 TaxID=2905871 RepID=UPI002045DBCB|nr:SDR family NAD(P)-dependent oxidoreductase [Herbiconiux sp. L3-i23]BDI21992.1 2-deoxy-D-gluconate 3-dehydrogenase [Herbiconiux sp. L3-i23]